MHWHPFANACLNATSAILLLLGWREIHAGRRDIHKRFMIAAFVTSGVFLVSYLVRVARGGTTPFPGTGIARAAYLTILFSHMALAIVILPMAIVTLRRGLAKRHAAHRRIARWTLPMWLYTSDTGVVVYVMLYHWPA